MTPAAPTPGLTDLSRVSPEASSASLTREEALAAPACVARQLEQDADTYRELGRRLRAAPPATVASAARGSSAHAASYGAFLIARRLGRLVAPLPMSLLTLHGVTPAAGGLLLLAVSQSGQSPDLVEPVRALRAAGATTAAWVNEPGSPLAEAAEWHFPLHAAPERSIVATRSCLAAFVGGALLAAHWEGGGVLLAALESLPAALRAAGGDDTGLEPLVDIDRMLVLGRAAGLSVAQEAALKLKETCGIQAEAFSAAEVQHGPMALVREGYPVLLFALRGPAQAGLLELAADLRRRGARVLVAGPAAVASPGLELVETAAEDLDPIAALQGFYVRVEALARARGLDPDAPPNLRKVTLTR